MLEMVAPVHLSVGTLVQSCTAKTQTPLRKPSASHASPSGHVAPTGTLPAGNPTPGETSWVTQSFFFLAPPGTVTAPATVASTTEAPRIPQPRIVRMMVLSRRLGLPSIMREHKGGGHSP